MSAIAVKKLVRQCFVRSLLVVSVRCLVGFRECFHIMTLIYLVNFTIRSSIVHSAEYVASHYWNPTINTMFQRFDIDIGRVRRVGLPRRNRKWK